MNDDPLGWGGGYKDKYVLVCEEDCGWVFLSRIRGEEFECCVAYRVYRAGW